MYSISLNKLILLASRYGVLTTEDGIEQPLASTFVIDKQGLIRLKYIAQDHGDRPSNSYLMEVLGVAESGKETEFIKLAELNYMGCRGCAAKCAGKELCPVEDDLRPYFPKIKEAEALVIGTVVYQGVPL